MTTLNQEDESLFSAKEVEDLIVALSERDNLTEEMARSLMRVISAEPSIRSVARAWLASGEMPEAPSFWGFTPLRIIRIVGRPSETFEYLHALCQELPGVSVALLEKKERKEI